MKISKKSLSTFGVVVGILSLSGVAYAFTSTDFNTRAQAWTTATCTQALINSRNNLSNNQKATICYNFLRANEQQNTLNGHQLSIDDLLSRAAVPGPKGDKGDTGEQGPVGPKGDTGEQGIQGLEGLSTRVKLYDGNNVLIGIEPTIGTALSTTGPSNIQAYNQFLGRKVLFDSEGRITARSVRYSSSGCTGDAYYSTGDSYRIDPSINLLVLKNTLNGQNYFITDSSAISQYLNLPSYRDENNVCTNSNTGGTAIKLIKVTLPFVEPLVLPISLRYE